MRRTTRVAVRGGVPPAASRPGGERLVIVRLPLAWSTAAGMDVDETLLLTRSGVAGDCALSE